MNMISLIDYARKTLASEFFKNLLKIFSGSIAIQIINFISIPIIIRIFPKDVIGLRDLFLSLIGTIAIISTLHYELAIILPKFDEDADDVFFLSLICLLISTTFLTMFSILFAHPLFKLLNAERIASFYYIVIVASFLKGLQSIVQHYLLRLKKFGKFSKANIAEIAVEKVTSALIGLSFPTFITFGIASSIGLVVSIIYNLSLIIKSIKSINKTTFKKIWNQAVLYKKFALFDGILVFITSFSVQLPVYMFSAQYGLEVVAAYSYAHKLVNLPLTLVSQAVSKVYFTEAAVIYRKSSKELGVFLLEY